jgi:hypothetical protein
VGTGYRGYGWNFPTRRKPVPAGQVARARCSPPPALVASLSFLPLSGPLMCGPVLQKRLRSEVSRQPPFFLRHNAWSLCKTRRARRTHVSRAWALYLGESHPAQLPRKRRPHQLRLPQARAIHQPTGQADNRHPHQADLISVIELLHRRCVPVAHAESCPVSRVASQRLIARRPRPIQVTLQKLQSVRLERGLQIVNCQVSYLKTTMTASKARRSRWCSCTT